MIAALILASTSIATPPRSPVWRLVWVDEFNGTRIDRTKWNFDIDCAGGGNEERQCYTDRPRNASVGGGMLTITARRESASGPAEMHGDRKIDESMPKVTKPFTSARMVTRRKASWLYGRIEVRARLPRGQGVWPAIWMMPEDDAYGRWPRSGEIDIMEAVNLGTPCSGCREGIENHVLGTIHFGDYPPDNRYLSAEVQLAGSIDAFHIYGLEWSPTRIAWSVDRMPYAERRIGDWSTAGSKAPHAPFDRPFHLILNLAIGGHLPEGRNLRGVALTGFPRSMAVDWVRVWQRPTSSLPSTNGAGT